jgi:PIN domain nuclease of toxin-antitoxin system
VGRLELILLDTHVVLWLSYDFGCISTGANKAIKEARGNESGIAVCSITLLEIARFSNHGRVQLAPDLEPTTRTGVHVPFLSSGKEPRELSLSFRICLNRK